MNFQQILDNVNQFLISLKDTTLLFLPKFVLAIIIVIIGYLVASLIKKVVKGLFRRVKTIVTKPKYSKYITTQNIEDLSVFTGKALFWIVLFFSFTIATESIGLPILTAWMSRIIEYLPNIFAAIIVLIAGFVGARIIADLLISAFQKTGIFYGTAFIMTIQYSIVLVSILIAINQIGIDISLFITIISILLAGFLLAAALSFAFGAKTTVSNIIASYYVNNTYKVNDEIKINDLSGKIIEITSTAIKLESSDGTVYIPAKDFNEYYSLLIRKDYNEK